jgi:hypothetical protein
MGRVKGASGREEAGTEADAAGLLKGVRGREEAGTEAETAGLLKGAGVRNGEDVVDGPAAGNPCVRVGAETGSAAAVSGGTSGTTESFFFFFGLSGSLALVLVLAFFLGPAETSTCS